jgi:hypothetical protein
MGAAFRFLLIAGFLAGTVTPGLAQYYPQRPPSGPQFAPPQGGDDDDGQDQPDDAQPDEGQPDQGQPDDDDAQPAVPAPGPYRGGPGPYRGGPGDNPYRYRHARMGFHCATRVGVCELRRPAERGLPCSCHFGYERRRGSVVR